MGRTNKPATGTKFQGSVEVNVACQFILCVRQGINAEVINKKHPTKRCRPIN